MTKQKLGFEEFCERLRNDGAYIGEDGHIYLKNGKIVSRQCPNLYYMVRKRYNGITYNFMEHRVVWYWANGSISEGLQINHKDFDRTNNHIDNLELMTAKENIRYSLDAGHGNPPRGERSGKATFSNKDAQVIRWLRKRGWQYNTISKLYGIKNVNTVGRVGRKQRYCLVPDATSVREVYPAIVKKAWNEGGADEAISGMEKETNALVELCKQNADKDAVLSKVGDILYYFTAFGNELGLDMTKTLCDI